MKYLFSSLLFFLIYGSLFSQNQSMERDSFIEEITKFFPQIDNEFVLDSTYDYDGSDLPDNEWSTFTKEVVSARTTNGLPVQILSISKWNEADFHDTLYKHKIDFTDLNDVDHFIITSSSKDIFTHDWKQTNKTILTTENDFEAIIDQSFINENWLNDNKYLSKETSLSLQNISLSWNTEESIWEYKNRYTITIDTVFNTETAISENYENQEWDTTYIRTIYSNHFGFDTLAITKRKIDNILTNERKTCCEYDSNNWLISDREYNWDEAKKKWRKNKKYEYSYDSNFISKTLFWTKHDSIWIPHYNEISEFNNNNKEISLTRMNYDTVGNEWINSSLYTREYDNGLIIFNRMYGWVDSIWVATDYVGYEYDEFDRLVFRYCSHPNYPKDRTFFEHINDEEHQSYSWHRQTYNSTEEKWINYEKNVDFKNIHLNNIENKTNSFLNIKPNPASCFLYIELPNPITNHYDYSIIDINGKVAQEGKISSNKMIDIQDLEIGTYIIEIRMKDNKSHSSKFIKL